MIDTILLAVTIVITGTVMFYIGVFYGAYLMLKDYGYIPCGRPSTGCNKTGGRQW